MLCCKPEDKSIDSSKQISEKLESILVDKGRYQCLVGKLIYLSHTRPNITFVVSLVNQFMNSPKKEHMDVMYRILRYLKLTLRKGILFRKNSKREIDIYTNANSAGNLLNKRSLLVIVHMFRKTLLHGEARNN